MIRSMTGFGRGESSSNGFQITVELKTLNSRYLDISNRIPKSIQHHEFNIKELIQDKLSRGKVHVNVNVEKTKNASPEITYNSDLVQAYGKMLEQMRHMAGIEQPITLQDILVFEEIF